MPDVENDAFLPRETIANVGNVIEVVHGRARAFSCGGYAPSVTFAGTIQGDAHAESARTDHNRRVGPSHSSAAARGKDLTGHGRDAGEPAGAGLADVAPNARLLGLQPTEADQRGQ